MYKKGDGCDFSWRSYPDRGYSGRCARRPWQWRFQKYGTFCGTCPVADVLPADIVGFSLMTRRRSSLVLSAGSCNVTCFWRRDQLDVLKTQSALLEVMEERQVTVDQRTYEVPEPFIVIATRRIRSALQGTQMLPESQFDRFMICISMGYPDIQSEIEIVKGNQKGSPADAVRSVMDKDLLLAMQKEVEEVYIHDAVYQYIGNLVEATRNHQMVRLGVSPRGTIALAKAAKAYAYLEGRTFCIPHDVESVFPDVTVHRLFLSAKARAARMDSTQVIEEILTGTKKPKAGKGRIE